MLRILGPSGQISLEDIPYVVAQLLIITIILLIINIGLNLLLLWKDHKKEE